MSLRDPNGVVAISCRNPRLRTSSLPMSLRDPNGVVAISCRNYRPHTNLFARTVCRLRGRRAGMPRATTVERTLAVGRQRPRRPACRNPIMHKLILLFPAHKSVISKFKIRRKLFTIHYSLFTKKPPLRPFPIEGEVFLYDISYFAYSVALVSRMTLTLICPGYSSSDSILCASSRASNTILSSETSSGLTIMRTSRPA